GCFWGRPRRPHDGHAAERESAQVDEGIWRRQYVAHITGKFRGPAIAGAGCAGWKAVAVRPENTLTSPHHFEGPLPAREAQQRLRASLMSCSGIARHGVCFRLSRSRRIAVVQGEIDQQRLAY